MWFVVMTVLGCGQSSIPTPEASAPVAAPPPKADAAVAELDCSMHDGRDCDEANARLTAIGRELATLDCHEGSEAKQQSCRKKKSALRSERSTILARWDQGYVEAAEEGGGGGAPRPAARTRSTHGGVPDGGGGTEGMEIDISDE